MIGLDELRVPKAIRPLVDEIVAITDSVCLAVLDEEYADLARRAVAKLARKRPSPLVRGRRATWAAGVVYALGQANFVFDPASELDVRHVPLEIQVAAFGRGFIPYIPALGPDGTAAWQESRVAGTAGAEAPSEVASLLEHCSELKRQLVEFACSPRFSGQLDQVLNENATGRVASEADVANMVDHFILQQPLADGRTVAEVFAAEHPDLTEDDRQVLQGWREVVEGVFEIREQAGDSITATSIGDDQTYRIRANAGRAALAPMRPGCFMTARVVPVGDDWMLSGAQQLYAASERPAMLRLAAELGTGTHAPGSRRNENDPPQVSRAKNPPQEAGSSRTQLDRISAP